MDNKPIYLDNNATTRVYPAVVEAMLPFFTEHFGNASSIHAFGSEVGKALKTARGQEMAREARKDIGNALRAHGVSNVAGLRLAAGMSQKELCQATGFVSGG